MRNFTVIHVSVSKKCEHFGNRTSNEGRPTFRVHMLLDHWYLKSWFSSRTANGPRKIKDWSGVMYNGQDTIRMKVLELRSALIACSLSAQGKKMS